jgi:hypothetical protein
VELGGEADLGVDDPVVGEVLGALGGHALQRLAGLHHRHRVGERLQVEDQVVAVGAAGDDLGQLPRVGGGEAVVAGLARQLHDGPRPQAPVQMVVEHDLRGAADCLDVQAHTHTVGEAAAVGARITLVP